MTAPRAVHPGVGAGLALLAGFILACGSGPVEDTRPNVLLITIDTLRADHLGSYGFPRASSPNIDALAAQGVVFERAVAAASSTAPSHASMMTSRYTRGHSIGYLNGSTRLEDAATLAERFREAGFATAAFVGNMVLRRRSGLDAGFEQYDDALPSAEANRSRVLERIATLTTDRALAWLEEVRAPFFLWVHYQDPHGPYAPPPAWSEKLEVEPEPGEEPLPLLKNNSGWRGIPAYQALPGLVHPSEYRSRYTSEILYTDDSVGELLAAVDSHASGRPTIVLLTSDHGESFGENERWLVHAFTTTPDNAHVPFVLRAPGLAPERRRGVASHVDVMPTLLELAGLDPPEAGDGIALGPYLRSGEPLPERRVYCDIGVELSAYGSDDFVRVIRVDFPWGGRRNPALGEGPPAWLHFDWHEDGSWSLAKDDDSSKPAIESYFGRVKPMVRSQRARDDEVDQLRALGYVDTGRD